MGPVVFRSERPLPRANSSSTSAKMDTAVASGERAPRSRPIGPWIRSISAVLAPACAMASTRSVWVRRLSQCTDVSGLGPCRFEEHRNVELQIVGEHCDDRGTIDSPRPNLIVQVSMWPGDDDFVGIREPLRRSKDRTRIADRHLVAEEFPELRQGRRVVDRSKDDETGGWHRGGDRRIRVPAPGGAFQLSRTRALPSDPGRSSPQHRW